MARKQMIEGGTKNKIVEVATTKFFEQGYDGTGVREVMRDVGADIGTFYYYFKSKDELFYEVLSGFFEPYKKDFAALAASAKDVPYRSLLRFFRYMKKEVRTFREKYADNMHFTVRYTIREQALEVIEPYIEEIIGTLVTYGAKPKMEPHLMAVFLTYGVGSLILHEDADYADKSTDDVRKTVNLIMGLDEETSRRMFEESED